MTAEPDLVRAILLVRTGHETTDDPGVLHQARSLYNAVRRAKTDVTAAHILHDGTCTYAGNAATTARLARWARARSLAKPLRAWSAPSFVASKMWAARTCGCTSPSSTTSCTPGRTTRPFTTSALSAAWEKGCT